MALTFTTGMTQADTALYNASYWHAYRINGTGGAPAASAADDSKQGANAVQAKLAGNNWDSGIIFDYYTKNSNTVLNLSTAGNEVLAIWVQYLVPPFLVPIEDGGLYILVQSSTETTTAAPTKYAKWYLGGNNVPTSGWKLFVIDTRKAPSVTAGGWVPGTDLAITRRIAFGVRNQASIGTVKGEPGYMDAVWYGRPRYKVVGDGSTTATWQDFATHSLTTTQNGLIEEKSGAYFLHCGIRFGDSAQGATTTFADATGKQLNFARKTYTIATGSNNGGNYTGPTATINVTASSGTFTKPAGTSFITLGFAQGQTIKTTGFTGGNNTTKVISSVTATTIVVTDNSGLADETGNGNEQISASIDALTYADYYVVDAQGTGTNKTSITIGSVVGTGDARQGVVGGGLRNSDLAKIALRADFQTNKTSLSAVKLYGVDFYGFTGGILLDNDATGAETDVISCAFVNCGEVDPGPTGRGATVLNCAVIDPQGGTATNRGLRLRDYGAGNDPRSTNLSCITSGTPTTQHLTHLPAAGTYSIAYNAIKFFGDYSSGTLWHGEASGNNTNGNVITINATGGANPLDTEFAKTGSPPITTVQVSSSATVTFDKMKDNTEVRVYKQSDGSEVAGIENATDGSPDNRNFAWSAAQGLVVDYVIHNETWETIRVTGFTVPTTNVTIDIQQRIDRNFSNPP